MNLELFLLMIGLIGITGIVIALKFKHLILVSVLLSVVYTLFKYVQILQFNSASISTSWALLLPRWNWTYLPLVLITYLIFVPALILVKRFGGRFYWGDRRRIVYGLALAIVIGVGLAIGLASQLPSQPITYVLTALTWSPLGAFVEEPLYRGALMTGLSERMGWKISLPIQAVVFGLSHPWSAGAVLGAIVYGLFLGVIARYLGLWSGISGHFVIDLLTSNTL